MSVNTTSTQIIVAAADQDLHKRLTAIAAKNGIVAANHMVESRLMEIVSAPLDDSDNTIASVYDYAAATYVPAPTPGANLAAVTDAYLLTALIKVGLLEVPLAP